jgi:ADP-ribose pyrophosphatase YjhB (NUDIX family)
MRTQTDAAGGFRRQVATFIRRVPWLMDAAQFVYRLSRPRYTVGVAGILFNSQRQVLLVEHVLHPYHPWGLPGGWVDGGEIPRQSLARELREELGIEAQVGPVVLIDETLGFRHLDLIYLCTTSQPIARLSPELLAYAWYDVDALPNVGSFQRAAILAAHRNHGEVKAEE